MFDFLNRLFGREPSSQTAKERLRLVLLSDHLSLAPDVVEALKHDLVDVISRYCEVDVANCDVTFEQQDKQIAMLANIPILGLRPRPPAPPAAPPPQPPAPEPPPSLDAAGATASIAAQPAMAAPAPNAAPKHGGSRRRRRRNAALKNAALKNAALNTGAPRPQPT